MFRGLLITVIILGLWSLPAGANSYVGSRACKRCHPQIYRGWRSTLHPYMLKEATDETLILPWNNVVLRFGRRKFRLFRRGREFWMEITHNGKTEAYRVKYILGGTWKELFITELPNGELRILPLSWVVEGEKWDLNDYWPSTLYQEKCMGCHVTGLRLERRGKRLVTRFRELGVGCEACHGPGEKHIEAPAEKKFETIVNPARIPNYRIAAMVCGACHSRGETPDGRYRYPRGYLPGKSFEFTFILKPILYPDGSPKANYEQYNDWLKSNHSRAGVMCWDCHEVHSKGRANRFQTKLPGSLLCRKCHQVKNKGVHGIHSVNICVGCHMPLVARRGLVRDIHSHQFRVVFPSWTLKIGSFEKQPNSCNACHFHRKDPPERLEKILEYSLEGLNF